MGTGKANPISETVVDNRVCDECSLFGVEGVKHHF